tara:strand:- start:1363 stop:2346 length:984 start_codon:yes stop_codon:yes gene_type:complete
MKVVFFHNVKLPVLKYGGIERILYWHMVELVKQGHKVVYIGHPESQVQDKGIELIPFDPKKDPDFEHYLPENLDILHLSVNAPVKSSVPYLITVHGNGQIGEVFPENSVFVSKKHAEIHGSDQFIHNALDLDEYPYIGRSKDKLEWKKFAFLAKASWRVKNLNHCVKAIKETKKHLDILGGRTFWPSRYVKSHGQVGGEEKLKLLSQCDALLFPVRWHEPFGLAMIEAMALGLPVIGSPYGSLPEIIKPNVGVTCQTFEEFQEVVNSQRPHFFDPDEIRGYVEERFAIKDYTRKYLELYRQVTKKIPLSPSAPTLQGGKRAEDLLPF